MQKRAFATYRVRCASAGDIVPLASLNQANVTKDDSPCRQVRSLVRMSSSQASSNSRLQKLPDGPLRDDILAQPDEITAEDYVANCRVWLRMLRNLKA